jgi:hypothetical protein
LTGAQKHTDHIATRQHLNRHADQRYVFYFFPTAQKKLKFCQRTIGTFASRTSRHTNPSLQKSQFSHPPQNDIDRLKGEKSYLNRLKIELN